MDWKLQTDLSNCKISWKKEMPKFRTKNVWLTYFWVEISKCYSHIWNLHPRICLLEKLGEKIKVFKFGNERFAYFWAGIWKYFCHIWKQHARIYLVAKFGAKKKKKENPRICNKKCFIWIFLGCHIWNQNPPIFLIAKFL